MSALVSNVSFLVQATLLVVRHLHASLKCGLVPDCSAAMPFARRVFNDGDVTWSEVSNSAVAYLNF